MTETRGYLLGRRDLIAGIAPLVSLAPWRAFGWNHPGAPQADLVIRGGRVVNADQTLQADVRIQGEIITHVGPNLPVTPATRVIDASGHLVMPGGIDPHTHLHPGFVDDLTTGSQAALAGGITTVGTFVFPNDAEPVAGALDRFADTVRRHAIADVFGHLHTWPPEPKLIDAFGTLVARGQPSIKFYMVLPDFSARLPAVIRALEAAREAGVVTMIHCEDAALLDAAARRLTALGKTALTHYPASRPVAAEVAATVQAAALCESTGAPMHVVHLSSGRALAAARAARAEGAPLSIETRPLYLHLTEERFRAAGPEAPLYVGQPPLRTRQDADALWAGLANGDIDILATDHAPWTRAQKLDPTLTITKLRPGVSDLQFMLPMYFSEGVGKRGLSAERFVATTATNAAKRFGLYPTKGVIRPGSDADIAIWNPTQRGTVTAAADYSNSDYSPYQGWDVTGWPVTVIRRGEVVVDRGTVVGRPGSGRLVNRSAWTGD